MAKAWLAVCLALLTFSIAMCIKTTSKPATVPEPSKETRDDEVEAVNLPISSFMDECNETFRTDMSYIEALNSSGSFSDETVTTAKCFVRCILEKSEVVSEDGVFDPDRAMYFFAAERSGSTPDDYRDSSRACSTRNETCLCDRAYQFVKCVMEMGLNKYVLF